MKKKDAQFSLAALTVLRRNSSKKRKQILDRNIKISSINLQYPYTHTLNSPVLSFSCKRGLSHRVIERRRKEIKSL